MFLYYNYFILNWRNFNLWLLLFVYWLDFSILSRLYPTNW